MDHLSFPLVRARRWFERLTTITVACEARRGLALWPRISPQATLVVVSSPGIEPCSVAFPWDFRIELTREAKTVIARIAGEWVLQPLHALAALPREVSRIEIEHTSELMARRVSEAVAAPASRSSSGRRGARATCAGRERRQHLAQNSSV